VNLSDFAKVRTPEERDDSNVLRGRPLRLKKLANLTSDVPKMEINIPLLRGSNSSLEERRREIERLLVTIKL
jgi:hypothetical protein